MMAADAEARDVYPRPIATEGANPRLSPEDATALAFLTVEEPVSNSTETPRHDMNNQDRFKGFWDGLDKARQPVMQAPALGKPGGSASSSCHVVVPGGCDALLPNLGQ